MTRPKPLILVADDDFVLRSTMAAILLESGYDVLAAEDGLQALDLVRAQCPDLLVLDLAMPGLDGFQVCERIRADARLAETPVLVLTGREDSESIRHAFDIGATDFATKPLSPSLLVHRVHFMLRSVDIMHELRESESRLANAQHLARLGNWEWDVRSGAIVGSPEAFAVLGFDRQATCRQVEELRGLISPTELSALQSAFSTALNGNTTLDLTCQVTLPSQDVRHVHLLGQLVRPQNGMGMRIVGTIQDITERARAEDRIRSLAYYDGLTGLPNRRLFTEKVHVATAMARRTNTKLALLLIDVDNFKGINDTLGHAAGDQVLCEVGRRLSETVRASDVLARDDSDDDFCPVARLGGDEFLVAVWDLESGDQAALIARRLLEALRAPFKIDSSELFVEASIGISVFPDDGGSFEEIFKNADVALYHAKDVGRNTSEFFSATMNESAMYRMLVETSLRRSLENDEMKLFYQPQFDVVSGQMVGVEALLRWTHHGIGQVSPAQFIPLAERIGMIAPLTEFVVTQASEQLRAWQAMGVWDLRVAVNLSAQLFRQPDLLQRLSDIPAACGVDPRLIELEITETALLDNPSDAERMLKQLRQRGFRIALDDFGAGYSSLSHLRRFPLDTLKIDRSFISDLVGGARELEIVGTLIDLAKRLGIEAVAEGVEEVAQRDLLIEKGCRLMQGYLLGRPMPADELTRLLLRSNGTLAPAA